MNVAALLKKGFSGGGRSDVMAAVAGDGVVFDVQMDACRRGERYLVTYRGGMIPLVLTGFMISVKNIELGVKRKMGICGLVVLVAAYVSKGSRLSKMRQGVI
jgi:hypothetical protein